MPDLPAKKSARPAKSAGAHWFAEGLAFACLPGCRRCCGGVSGDVWVTEDEIAVLARACGIERDEFERQYVREYASGRKSLRERANADCVLLSDTGCAVYAARPLQCRAYPFWPEILRSPAAWQREMKRCPGLGSGLLHSEAQILEWLRQQDPEQDS